MALINATTSLLSDNKNIDGLLSQSENVSSLPASVTFCGDSQNEVWQINKMWMINRML